MTDEEAGELVLRGWVPCPKCEGQGRRTITRPGVEKRVACKSCCRAGYIMPSRTRWAFTYLGIPIPPKPLTPTERLMDTAARTLADAIKEPMRASSMTRKIMPPIKVEKP